MSAREGLVQIYTGDGKGKTTAAFGLALRAAGSGLKVYIYQFMKAKPCGEIRMARKIPGITLDNCGRGCFIKGKPGQKDIESASRGLECVKKIVMSGKYDLVVLDEINVAAAIGLVKERDIVGLIGAKPRHVELVLTGRSCPAAIMKRADLITEMKEIRHPFRRGIIARCGIEY